MQIERGYRRYRKRKKGKKGEREKKEFYLAINVQPNCVSALMHEIHSNFRNLLLNDRETIDP